MQTRNDQPAYDNFNIGNDSVFNAQIERPSFSGPAENDFLLLDGTDFLLLDGSHLLLL